MPNSVLRRYTPPTCTLQVVAYSSPVSRWVGRSVVKQVQFDLGLDDPRLPAEQRVHITGDGDRLEALHIAVTNYIQQLLAQSPETFKTTFWQQATSTDDGVAATTSEVEAASVDLSRDGSAPQEVSESSAPQEVSGSSDRIFFQPTTGLAHNLFLGSLATVETGQVVPISTLQLFDLATALDDYAADLVALPTPFSRTQNSPAPMAWANIAAVLLLGVGVSALALQIFDRSNPTQTAKTVAPSNTNSQVALAPSPLPTIAATETLPPPPVVGSISPSPLASAQVPGNTTVPTQAPVPTTATAPGKTTSVPGNSIANQLPPQPSGNPSPNPNGVAIAVPQKGAPANAPVPPIAIIPNSASNDKNTSTRNRTAAAARQNEIAIVNNPPPAPPPSALPTAPKAPTTTAYNDVPQVAEVRDYFNKRWQPPASLRQSLQYSIVLDVDGSVQLIEPYGAASRLYLDRTGMPLIGERFVSPNANGQNPRIRVRFNPDGKVQTFLEVRDSR
ncbi:DUF4335 domain-containing protein [Aliterella atlantica]|uniref:DUF4335 domain-containing protein n=1 Tax=Aliterella atlantica CENA595 TaxID=1618023 RepID=A0A0D8ZX06_9CYAN|nr:DUF4335 domain-containing protein [Aliterella atlantica]KJH72932.1 hypothetical protein UH38_05205 [Aliterella atlantica CENA595]